jgi:hypothetical protein
VDQVEVLIEARVVRQPRLLLDPERQSIEQVVMVRLEDQVRGELHHPTLPDQHQPNCFRRMKTRKSRPRDLLLR